MCDLTPIREIKSFPTGPLREGRIAIGVDCDAVTIWTFRKVRLTPADRDKFIRYYFQAESAAEDWARQYPGPDVDDAVDAEIWCGWHATCVNGPGDHTWMITCCGKDEAASDG
jgi:hypothetical protein